jgi:pentose-5-phosphate-3-epimerase
MEIIPALLVTRPIDLNQQLERLSKYFQHFQIDVADGIFVPEKTLSIAEIQETLADFTSQVPLSFDFDLMVNNPMATVVNEIDKFSPKLDVKTIFIHDLNSFQSRPNLGIAIDPQITAETVVQALALNTLPIIQIMSVTPGAQGRTFIPETLNKIEYLRRAGYKNKIYLDGGVNEKSVPTILEKQFRPNALCIGTYLTQVVNLEERVNQLRQIQSQ